MTKPKVKRAAGDNPQAVHFVKNADLLAEIIACKANNNVCSDKLARMLLLMCQRYSMKSNFLHYSNREDMVAASVFNLIRNWHKFDETKWSNPFAYFTTAIYRTFLQGLADEKEQRVIRDELLIEQGVSPSWGYDGTGLNNESPGE